MRDTSEITDAIKQEQEPTKPTRTRSRSTARAKAESTASTNPESTVSTSQEQEKKPAPRRRSTSTTRKKTATSTPQTIEDSIASSQDTDKQVSEPQNITVTTTPNSSDVLPAQPRVGKVSVQEQEQNKSEGVAPAPLKSSTRRSTTGEETSTSSTPTRRATRSQAPRTEESPAQQAESSATPRPGSSSSSGQQAESRPMPRPISNATPRPGSSPGQQAGTRPTPRPISGATPRPGNSFGQQAGTRPMPRPTSGATPRPGSGFGQQAGTRPMPRPTSGAGQRPGYPSQSRPQNVGSTTTQPGYRPSTTQRPPYRPGGTAGATGRPARPGIQGHHPNQGRRSPSPAQRQQERRAAAVKEKPTGPVSIPPQLVVKDLADILYTTPNEVIRNLIKHSVFANINQIVDYDKAALVAQDLGFEPTQSAMTQTAAVQGQGSQKLSANEAMIASRNDSDTVVIPPVVTIMGHVDHGKTSLLDVIRQTKVAVGEAGGITQHIGAYQVEVNGKKITFLDTPGHEAFTAMRARGAQVTHITIIVIAADDGVMPQTREAIDHAQAAKVPIVIALNKIDKANANPDHVKQQLAEMGLVVEEYGGEIICVPVSARKGEGIDELLEYILLVAEMQDIRANPHRPALGVIIEAKLEKNSGAIATVLIQQGTLKMGDNIVVGAIAGKVRAMFNDRGKRIQKALPSTPVSLLGLSEVPQAGDRLDVLPDERSAKQMAQQETEKRHNETTPLGQVSLDTLYMQMQEGTVKELNVVLKSDVQGSSEALKNSLSKLSEENMKVRLIREGIGNISETDVHLAAASKAIVVGFNVTADGAAQREAQKEGVDIRYYNVIYKLIDDIQAALVGMLEPTYQEVINGHAEVRQIFKAGKNTVIAGCRITDGKIVRSSQARVLRAGKKVFEGLIGSLRRGKDDVREVASGYECGIILEDFNECEVGDSIEAFAQERVKAGSK